MGCFNRFLLLLTFNVLNILAFGAIIAVAVINITDHNAPTNLLIYYAYTGLLSLVLCVCEIRVPRALYAQTRFLFTYTGRGIVLTYFGCIVYTSKLFNVIACIYTVTLGVVYVVVAWVSVVPVHDGVLSNWSRWVHEGKSDERREVQNVDPEHKVSYVHDVVGAPIHGHHASVQSIVWPSDMPAGPHESFVYGVSAHPAHVQSTGDAYLDSIVNSSRFAREVMDPTNESIVVRSSRGLAEDAERPRESKVTISSPMAYHVFAPKSREELVENMALVNQALASDRHDSVHRFSQ
ncbi:hypothetical protein IW136_001395 [Coemansia sp. RSA 678]|nr:hypothetical protein IW136_001395 [Coemansia sp. RSA 678]